MKKQLPNINWSKTKYNVLINEYHLTKTASFGHLRSSYLKVIYPEGLGVNVFCHQTEFLDLSEDLIIIICTSTHVQLTIRGDIYVTITGLCNTVTSNASGNGIKFS